MRTSRSPSPRFRSFIWTLAAPLAASLAACDSDGAARTPVAVRFAARIGDAAVACGPTYPDVGSSHTSFTLEDLRFYVHDLRLVASDGAETPVTLAADGKWQGSGVALLDFEDKTGACQNGTPDTNDRVVGTAPPGDYVGLRFALGVPPALDHLDTATAVPPLDLGGMFWGWTLGYKFFRLDGKTASGAGWSVHLGSIGCTREGAGAITCSDDNVAAIDLPAFDPARDVVVVDVGALLAASDLEANQPPSAGCMSDLDDADCPTTFARFGLPFDGVAAPGPQVVFVKGAP
ncbi:MAG: metallo-mystery pair system four-Cys motif protein [Myxococcota bacterium]